MSDDPDENVVDDRDDDRDDDWDDISQWWVDAVRDDPTQSTDTSGLLAELIVGTSGLTLDLGCGEGQGMRLVGEPVIGTDLSLALLTRAASAAPVVQARLPDLSWVRPGCLDRAIAVGIIDMIDDHVGLFVDTARAVRAGGHLLVVMNHPVATAPDSEPLVDPKGEILWRWGSYLVSGSSPQPAADRTVELFHRPLGELLTTAADAGWSLERMIERGPSAEAIERFPGFRGQGHIPSMLGLRWRRAAGAGR
jgi:SAM-dependent methyltransferase